MCSAVLQMETHSNRFFTIILYFILINDTFVTDLLIKLHETVYATSVYHLICMLALGNLNLLISCTILYF